MVEAAGSGKENRYSLIRHAEEEKAPDRLGTAELANAAPLMSRRLPSAPL